MIVIPQHKTTTEEAHRHADMILSAAFGAMEQTVQLQPGLQQFREKYPEVVRAMQDAIAAFQKKAGNKSVKKYLRESTIYTTLEPCPMCAGAILMCRIKRVVICMPDFEWGALGTVDKLENLPHTVQVDYCDLPECQKLKDLHFGSFYTKLFKWEIGRKYYQQHKQNE